MNTAYAEIIKNNLARLFEADLDKRARAMRATRLAAALTMPAFGAPCRLSADGITLDDQIEDGPRGIIISLYGLCAVDLTCALQPFKAFKELPGSMPYAGAFVQRSERALVPFVERIAERRQQIVGRLNGPSDPPVTSGDFSMLVFPLPKIALCYIFYKADEDFEAGVTCLFSANADRFLPTDALADVGEYTAAAILDMIR